MGFFNSPKLKGHERHEAGKEMTEEACPRGTGSGSRDVYSKCIHIYERLKEYFLKSGMLRGLM